MSFAASSASAVEDSHTVKESGLLRPAEYPGAAFDTASINEESASCSPMTAGRELCVTQESSATNYPRSATASAGALTKAASNGANELVCSTAPTEYTYERFGSCLGNRPINITELKDGKPVGSALLYVSSRLNLDRAKLSWKESIRVKYESFEGKLTTNTFHIAFTAGCNRSCKMATASPWAGQLSLTPNQTLSGDVEYNVATPNSGFNGGITTNYKINVMQAGTVPVQPNATWSNPRTIRCDDEVSSVPGCVYPHIAPELVLPLSTYKEAAATYLFQQQYSDHPLGTKAAPLHRLADLDAQEANRDSTCVVAAEGTVETPELFVRKSSRIPDDSCDEYPFAASVEGGTPGAYCNDVEFELANGEWIYAQANSTKPLSKEARCSRGHVPLDLNTAAGQELGRLVQAQRMIDFDAYTVRIPA
ncbi:hypothetical protein LT966_32825 [Streptomyces griseobrunneus]